MTPLEPPPLDSLLAQRRYVHALASELVFDAHLAQDVEQEVLLACLEHRPRDPRALRGWLAVLVRNFARKAWLAEDRRTLRERAAARSEAGVPSPAEILAGEEQRRRLIGHVLALEAPLRDALVLRYFQELPPRAIARRLGVPLDTVRSRLQRGLELLRQRLERENGGGRGAWALALVRGLEVPASGAQLLGGLVSSSVAGVVVMSLAKKAALAVVVLVLLAAGLYLRARLGRAERPESAPGAIDVLAATDESVELTAPPREEPGADPQRTAIEAALPGIEEAAPAEGSVLLRVSWHDGSPAEGIGAFVETSASMFERTLEVHTGPEGTCRIEHLKPGKIRVRLDRHAGGSVEVEAGERVELSLTIENGNDIVGIVVDADGNPVAGADVYVDHGFLMGHVIAHSGPDGRFGIRSISRGMVWLSARAPFHAPTPQVLVGGVGKDKDPRTEDVRLVFLARGGALEGVLLDSEGKPVTNAQVLVGDEIAFMKEGELDPIPLPGGGEAFLPSAERVTVDGQGRFRVEGVAVGRQAVGVRAPGFGQWNGQAEIRAGELTRMEIELLPGTTVEGRLRDAAGNPIENLPIVLAGECAFRHHSANSGADGSFVLHDLPDGAFELQVFKDGAPTTVSAHLVGSPGAVLRWDPVLGSGLVIRGRVVARGLDPTRFTVQCTGAASEQGMLHVDTALPDASGRFEFPDRADVPHRLEISSSEQPSFPLAVRENVLPTGAELVIEIDPAQWPSARFRGRVLDAAGAPLAGARVMLKGAERGLTGGPLWPTDPTGAFDFGPYPPGRWRIQVWRLGMAKPLFVSDEVQVSAGETFDFGDLLVE